MKLTEIEAILGEPAMVTRFVLPNNDSGLFDFSNPNQTGPPFAQWACYMQEMPMQFPCTAVQHEGTDEWFMLNACPKHANLLRDLPFRDIDYFLPSKT